ncbi:MAG: FAD-dependent oxidoreductase, partial [Chitinophagales bacterium]|nr:FAD-dependent oxidoreductase [Chitinophagales bacterium]MDW8273014.1 FAD-dependent oxidoreductase [Chitinophagales bacterium]
MYDVIIAGQGVAGSLLAWECIKHQFKVLLFDPGHSLNASLAAGAIINPVTGKNLQKSWMVDELIPAAIKTYREIEERLQQRFITDLKIYHIFKNTKEINDWSVKRYEEAYQKYLINPNIFFIKNDEVINPLGAFEIKGGLKVNAYMLLTALREWFKNQNILIEEYLNEDQICEKSDYVQYKEYKA